MMLTEKEAHQKWCPFARVAGLPGSEAALLVYNRWPNNAEVERASRCLGSACMAWRWAPVPSSPALGDVDPTIAQFIGEQKLINAIKRRRELTGEGLKEAKDYVESISGRFAPQYRDGHCGLAGPVSP
jgi:hypothetical protein